MQVYKSCGSALWLLSEPYLTKDYACRVQFIGVSSGYRTPLGALRDHARSPQLSHATASMNGILDHRSSCLAGAARTSLFPATSRWVTLGNWWRIAGTPRTPFSAVAGLPTRRVRNGISRYHGLFTSIKLPRVRYLPRSQVRVLLTQPLNDGSSQRSMM